MAKKKRGQGEGSIFEEKRGRWRASASLGWKNGKRIRKTFTASTRGEVQEKLTKTLRDRQLGINVAPQRLSVGQFLDTWLEIVVKKNWRPKTYQTYSDVVRLHIKPVLGRRLLTKLSAIQVQAFLNDKLGSVLCPYCKGTMPVEHLEQHVEDDHGKEERRKPLRTTGLSPRSVRYIHATLRDALNVAVKWDLIPRNVATLVEPPRAKKREMRAFTPDQARAYLNAASGDRLEALFTGTLALGLRKGEALGLGWEQLDLEAGILTVSRALQRVEGKLQFVDTKPGKSRTIMLPAVVLSALWKHRAKQADERHFAGTRWREHDLVFTTTIGTPLDPPNVSRSHHAILKRAQLPPLRFHDLRHSAATLLLAQGASPKYIADLLGHTQVAFTMQTYAHCIPDGQRDVAAKMDAILNPVATSVATSTPSRRVH